MLRFVKIRHEDTRFSIPNFGGSVLGWVDADCCDQVLDEILDGLFIEART